MPSKLTYEKLQALADELRDRCNVAEQMNKNLFDYSHSIMIIIHPETGRIVDANMAACKYYGYEKDEITNLRIMDINNLPEEQVLAEMKKAELEKRKYFQFHHRLSNGETRDVEVYSGPITLNGEKLLYSIINDISERKQYEYARESLVVELELALSELRTMRARVDGIRICAGCKKVSDGKGRWHPIQSFIHDELEAKSNQDLCPHCAEEQSSK